MKNKRSWISALALAFVMSLGVLAVSETAYAQSSKASAKTSSKADKNSATKKGVAGSLGSKEIEQNKLPGKLEIGIALGSVAGAVAAIKWL